MEIPEIQPSEEIFSSLSRVDQVLFPVADYWLIVIIINRLLETYAGWKAIVNLLQSPNKKKIARQPTLTSQKFYYSSSILRHHVALFIDTFACLIKGTKLIVMWESPLSRGLTSSKVNMSSADPMGSNGWGRGERWRGRGGGTSRPILGSS